MTNNLRQAQRDMKALAKQVRGVRYTEALLFTYLMTGMITFSTGLNTNPNMLYERVNKEIVMAADSTRLHIKKTKKQNEKEIDDAELELIELMEQGDQVVKSPWSSWQFGVNTFASRNSGVFKGYGDKEGKYMYSRGDWSQRGVLLTKGRNAQSVMGQITNYDSTRRTTKSGLVNLLDVQEPEVEIQIMANVRPKSIQKEEIKIEPQIDMPKKVIKPNVTLNVNKPLDAPVIKLPTITPVSINVTAPKAPQEPVLAQAPSISMQLSSPNIEMNITAPSVNEIQALTVTQPQKPAVETPKLTINNVEFQVPSLASFGNTITGDRSMSGNTDINGNYKMSNIRPIGTGNRGRQNSFGEYMGKDNRKFTISSNSILDLDVSQARAISLDAGLPAENGGKNGTSHGNYGVQFSVENNGTILLNAETTAAMDIQADIWDYSQVSAINSVTGKIIGNKDSQAAFLATNEGTYRASDNKWSKENEMVFINQGEITLNGNSSAGFATDNFRNVPGVGEGKNILVIAKNEGIVNLNGKKNHGMVVSVTTNALKDGSTFENTSSGSINISGPESGGITLLDKLEGGAVNNGTITITGNNSFGLYSKVDSEIKNNNKIIISGNATGSMGIRVGSVSATNMKNTSTGTITINSTVGGNMGVFSETAAFANDGKIDVNGDKNIGMYFRNIATGINGNNNTINIAGTNGYGVMLENTNFKNSGTVAATGSNSIGVYAGNSTVTNESGKTISSDKYHAVVQNGGTFTNEGNVTTNGGGAVALYSENGTFSHDAGTITANNGGIGIFNNNSTGTVKSEIVVGNSTTSNTGMGVYSEAGTTTFSDNAKLTLGEKTIGLYSSDTSEFGNRFSINKLETSIGKNAVFAYFGNVGTPTVNITNSILGNLTVSKMAAGSALFYSENGTTVNIDDNLNTTVAGKFSNVSDKAQLFVTNGGTVNINSGKILTSNIKTTISGINSATVKNDGTLALTGNNGAVGIYLNNSTGSNNNIITTANEGSTAIYGNNNSTLENKGNITTSGKSSVGLFGDASTVSNLSGTIKTEAQGSAGMFGKNDSTVTNAATVDVEGDKSAGIYTQDSNSTNNSNGVINVKSGESAGMFAKLTTNATKDYSAVNNGNINLTPSGTQNKSVGIYGETESGVSKVLTLKNEGNATISVDMDNSVGILAKNNVSNGVDKISVLNNGKIAGSKTKSIGISATKSTVTNAAAGKIEMSGDKSAGIYGETESTITNLGKIKMTNNESAGIFLKNSDAENKNSITIEKSDSAGIYGEFSSNSHSMKNSGTINVGNAGSSENKSAGMYGLLTGGTLNITNENAGNINVNMKKSAGIFAESSTGSNSDLNAENQGTVTVNGNESVGMYGNKSTLKNSKDILVKSDQSTGMFGKNGADVLNSSNITVEGTSTGSQSTGIYVSDSGTKGKNAGTITLKSKNSTGMAAIASAKIENAGTIVSNFESVIGMYGKDTGTEVLNSKDIEFSGKESTGIFVKDNAKGKNTGKIKLDGKSSVGMFGASSAAGNKIELENGGTIEVNKKNSTGMFASNVYDGTTKLYTGSVGDSIIKNTGTINLNDESTVGIYTPKSTISQEGNIVLSNAANSSVGVYLTQDATVDGTSGTIDLNKNSQNQVAYYIKNSGKIQNSIGRVNGYGVGVYLDGTNESGNNSSTPAELVSTTPALDFTTGADGGNGIIGLVLKGNTKISSYTGGIKVGNTDGQNYAIGIYADKQGGSTPKTIDTSITTGANGVGLFADNGSKISYTGQMKIGDGTTAGTGIYIGNGGGSAVSEVTIASGSNIKLNGSNGVGAIVTTGSTVNFQGGSKIELGGSGVAIFGQRGAIINDGGGTFTTSGYSSERIRLTEGPAITKANVTLETGNVMSHVINGEAILNSGFLVNATAGSKNIIGLMAEGNENETLTAPVAWRELGYEVVNNGTLDLSNATSSTGIYLDSARGKNAGPLKVGDKSTAIYGVYNSSTAPYSGAAAGYVNKSEILNEATGSITIGNGSAGIYAIGFDKVENKGPLTGGNNSVGIYATDKDISGNIVRNQDLNVKNSGNITIGNGSAAIYVTQNSANKATVNNTGNLTVGDSVLNPDGTVKNPAVAMFIQNGTLTTTGNVTVGNRAFAFYGKDATINVNGGNYNFANSGSLGYLENSTLNYNNTGTLATSSEPLLFIDNSKAILNGNDIFVSANGVGAYMTGKSEFTGWNKITLGASSTGIYVDSATAKVNGNSIVSTNNKAKGIVALNSNVTNDAKISLSGDDSIGIFSRNTSGSAKQIVSNQSFDISGKRSIGIYLEGTDEQNVINNGTMNIAATTDSNKNNSTVGIYAKGGSKINITNNGTINVNDGSFGIYSLSETGNVTTNSVINVADQAIGIYKRGGSVNLSGTVNVAPHTATALNSEPVGVYGTNGVVVSDNTSNFNVGDKSYGVILANPGTATNFYTNSATEQVSLGNESTFLYSEGKSVVVNNANINSGTNGKIIAIYAKDGGYVANNGNIDLSQGLGNIGVYSTGLNSVAVNSNGGVIRVGETDASDKNNVYYGIAMAATDGGAIENRGDIYVTGGLSMGMYGNGAGTTMRNSGNIYLDASGATAAKPVNTMIGVFADNGAKFVNEANGVIRTAGSYSGNDNVKSLVGVAVLNGSTLENYGTIDIDADRSYGVLIKGTQNNKSVIKNYGTINITGSRSYGVRYDANSNGVSGNSLPIGKDAENTSKVLSELNAGGVINSANGANDYYAPKDPSKTVGGVGIVTLPNGKLAIQRNGVILTDSQVQTIDFPVQKNIGFSNFGVYVDTLGRTKPINLNGVSSMAIDSDLIIGTEFSRLTNSKNVAIGSQILDPFLNQIRAGIFNFTPYSSSLTWMATPEVDPVTGQITRVLMTKIPYTAFVSKTSNEYNFTDGLEQRYDMNALDSREKEVFEKLNGIGNNEQVLLAQAYDEMMGHQYANVQQRIFETGHLLNKEFDYLYNEWETKSKQSNKIKVFGMKNGYKTDSEGIIDYDSNAYGVAYLHEDETVHLGDTKGWYAGFVRNNFKFDDLGKSREVQQVAKAGIFKSTPFDYNNSLNWTISSEVFGGLNSMKRKFAVVDDIFEAKSEYYSYGAAVKNEVSKTFRTSEKTSIKPYASLALEYGRFTGVKEKDGQVRLEVKGNDYYSIKPEVGVQWKFKQKMAKRTTFIATVGLAYESELGKVNDADNRARVNYTTADWYNLRGEKENRRGNGKADLNLGIENTRLGVTLNAGYDTDVKNLRGGFGIRIIY